MKNNNSVALVLGGHVNGYSIVKELYEQNIKNIAVFDSRKSLAEFSNKVVYRARIDESPESLLNELNKLNELYDYIVLYPTNDLQLVNLLSIYNQIKDFCYVPFNVENLLNCSDKSFQYEVCERIGVPYPKTVSAKKVSDLDSINELFFPLIVKPSTRKDLTLDVFRTLYLETEADYINQKQNLADYIDKGIEFVISEYIPGDDTNIYAYTCFRSNQGEILNAWVGKKLTQYPDNYGVFCSSSNQAPKVIEEQGKALIEALNVYGIVEPEFKYDSRDGKFKLMETNLRSMMWNRTGNISGVFLQKTQFDYATNEPVIKYTQDISKSIHFVLMLHEIPNLITRRGYWKNFKHNIFGGNERVWAIFESNDIKPFFYSLNFLAKMGVGACLRRFDLR